MTANNEQGRVLSSQELAILGAKLRDTGFNEARVRSLMGDVEAVAEATSLAMAAKILDSVRDIHEKMLLDACAKISAMPAVMGYVSRTTVLTLLLPKPKRTVEG